MMIMMMMMMMIINMTIKIIQLWFFLVIPPHDADSRLNVGHAAKVPSGQSVLKSVPV